MRNTLTAVAAMLVISLCAWRTQAYSPIRICAFLRGRPGILCNDQLTGYMLCDGSHFDRGRNIRCADTEICSCGLRRPCPKEKPLCVKRPEFNNSIIPHSFMVGYTGVIHNDNLGGFEQETINGMVYQDIAVKGDEKFRKTTTYRDKSTGETTKQITELIVRSNAAYRSYVKVSGRTYNTNLFRKHNVDVFGDHCYHRGPFSPTL